MFFQIFVDIFDFIGDIGNLGEIFLDLLLQGGQDLLRGAARLAVFLEKGSSQRGIFFQDSADFFVVRQQLIGQARLQFLHGIVYSAAAF